MTEYNLEIYIVCNKSSPENYSVLSALLVKQRKSKKKV